jgi:alkylation response protein AidB-like acyl-CoA dehydrogenase
MTTTDDPVAVLAPLLGKALPPARLSAAETAAMVRLQHVLDTEIAPLAEENDRIGRYPTASVAALKRSGVLHTAVPAEFGGMEASHRFSMEAQVRIAMADSALAQLFKVHDELVREIFVYCPSSLRPWLAEQVVQHDAIIGLAVAEGGRKVDDPLTTLALPHPDGGFTIDGTKIYTTAAAEADYIAVWAWNPEAFRPENPILGMQLNLVPRNTPGVHIHRDWDAMGQRATDSGTITFTGVRTDPALAASVPGNAPLPQSSVRYQAGFAAVLVGIGLGAVKAAAPFVVGKSRPWPSAGVDNATDDPMVQRLCGELVADLASAYAFTLACGDLLDDFEAGLIDRTALAVPIYAAKAAASRAAVRATSELHALMGTRSVARVNGFDRWWRNARTLSLHDPVDWKHVELGRHVLTGWDPPPGIYQ